MLFAAARLLCAGMSFAQNPVKKETKAKATTEKPQAVKSTDQAAQKEARTTTTAQKATPAKGAEQNVEKNDCGKCPHHQQCNKNAQTKAPAEAKSVEPARKPVSKDDNKAVTRQNTANQAPSKK